MNSTARRELIDLHLRFGWASLLVFLTLGAVLEALHGFKIGFYLSLDNQTRRELWTLAHAHGTLLGLVNLAFATTIAPRAAAAARQRAASLGLQVATPLLPVGFFLGGVGAVGGDPGMGILLVPVAAVALIASALMCTLIVFTDRQSRDDDEQDGSRHLRDHGEQTGGGASRTSDKHGPHSTR